VGNMREQRGKDEGEVGKKIWKGWIMTAFGRETERWTPITSTCE